MDSGKLGWAVVHVNTARLKAVDFACEQRVPELASHSQRSFQ
jgi:hypothetical protein